MNVDAIVAKVDLAVPKSEPARWAADCRKALAELLVLIWTANSANSTQRDQRPAKQAARQARGRFHTRWQGADPGAVTEAVRACTKLDAAEIEQLKQRITASATTPAASEKGS